MKNKENKKAEKVVDVLGQLEIKTRHLESQIRGDFYSLGRGRVPHPLIETMRETREEIVKTLKNRANPVVKP